MPGSYKYALNRYALPATPVLERVAKQYGLELADHEAGGPARVARWTSAADWRCVITVLFVQLNGDCHVDLRVSCPSSWQKQLSWKLVVDVLPIASTDERWVEVLERARLLAEAFDALGEPDGPLDDTYMSAIPGDDRLRREQVLNLLIQKDQRAIPVLLLLLRDEQTDVRRMAAAALGRLVGEERREVFAALLDDPSLAVQHIARQVLKGEYRRRSPT